MAYINTIQEDTTIRLFVGDTVRLLPENEKQEDDPKWGEFLKYLRMVWEHHYKFNREIPLFIDVVQAAKKSMIDNNKMFSDSDIKRVKERERINKRQHITALILIGILGVVLTVIYCFKHNLNPFL